MGYKDKYNKLVEAIKVLQETNPSDEGLQNWVNDNVPELKESEDERIRKELIAFLRSYDTFLTQRFIAWLEKQGEQKLNGTFVNVDDVREDFIDEVYRVLDSDSTNDRANQIIDAFDSLPTVTIKQDPCEHCQMTPLNCYSFPCDEKREFEQGKTALEAINEEKVDNSNRVEPKDYNSIDPHFMKPVDKAEPKFHEGEWIVWQDKCYKVNYNGCGYELVGQNGLNTSLEYGTIDETAHLFTIEDAKAGDILATGQGNIFIFKSISDCVVCDYCGLYYGKFMDCSANVNSPKSAPIGFHPATKEQRDKLEKEMADAGYTFDFEKKELKKIEDEIEIPFGSKDSELQEDTYYIPKGFHAEIDEDKVVIKKGEKPTWSEMDKTMVRCITSDLELLKNRGDGEASKAAYQGEIKWLKSLKDRVGCEVNCTTTKKWSEEDIATISRVISIVKWAAYSDHSHPILNDEGATELVERLKSLKERYTWKPSDEQMEALNYVVNLMASSGSIRENYYCIVFKDLREQLKKLK